MGANRNMAILKTLERKYEKLKEEPKDNFHVFELIIVSIILVLFIVIVILAVLI